MKQWEDFLQSMASEIGSEAFDKWAKPLKVIHFDAGNLYLEAADSFQLAWFEEHLRPKARQLLKNHNQRPIKVHLSLANPLPLKEKKAWKPTLTLASDPIDPTFCFETYFPGKTNAFHFALLRESIEKKTYNPIYLQGPEGVGKSHLLAASAKALIAQNKSCLYVKASSLTYQIVAAIRSSGMQKLRDYYRKHDALIIDQIDKLANRSATQEELFHTFNALHLTGKLILLAGRKSPAEIEGIEPRLTSRFEWGLILPFLPLTAEERKEWFAKTCAERKLSLLKEVEIFFLENFMTIAHLTEALNRVPQGPFLSLDFVKGRIEPLIKKFQQMMLTPEKIIQITAEVFEIGASDLLGRKQDQTSSLSRQMAMYLCRDLLKIPFLKIGEIFSRDHSTVMTSIKNIEKKMKEHDNVILSQLQEIKSRLIPS